MHLCIPCKTKNSRKLLLSVHLHLLIFNLCNLLSSQFEKEEQIHSIDIGNEGSSFIEVLVGNSSAVRDQDYEVILLSI